MNKTSKTKKSKTSPKNTFNITSTMEREQLELDLLAAKIEYYNMCSQKMKDDAARPAASRSRRRPAAAKSDESASEDKPVETTKSSGGASRKRSQPTPLPKPDEYYTPAEVDTWDKAGCSSYLKENGLNVPVRITLLELQARVNKFIKENRQSPSDDEESSEDEEAKAPPAKRKVAIRFEDAPKLDAAKEVEKASPISNAEKLAHMRNKLNNEKAAASQSSTKSRQPIPPSPASSSKKLPPLPSLGKKTVETKATETTERKANVLKHFQNVSKEARTKKDATRSTVLSDSEEEHSDGSGSDGEEFDD